MAILPNSICRFNSILIKIPNNSYRLWKKQYLTSKGKWQQQIKQNNQSSPVLKKKQTAGGITISDFKFYHREIVVKTAWY